MTIDRHEQPINSVKSYAMLNSQNRFLEAPLQKANLHQTRLTVASPGGSPIGARSFAPLAGHPG